MRFVGRRWSRWSCCRGRWAEVKLCLFAEHFRLALAGRCQARDVDFVYATDAASPSSPNKPLRGTCPQLSCTKRRSSHRTFTHPVHARALSTTPPYLFAGRPPLLPPPLYPQTQSNMAANGAQQGFEPVLAAHNMMQSAGNRAQKEQAHQFLEQFQKSVCRGWTIVCGLA